MADGEPRLPPHLQLVKLGVASGTQVSTRTADIVKHLGKDGVVVSLTAKSRNASKLISVVEIAKRELLVTGVNVFQYNALGSETVQVERKKIDGSDSKENDESDDAFETPGGKTADGPKQRLVPVMTVYLSTSSIGELKSRYG